MKNLKEFDEFLLTAKGKTTAFARLPEDKLMFFKVMLQFHDDNFVSGYWGDIAELEGLSTDQMADLVHETFGTDRDTFKRTYHGFGDGQGNCWHRPYFNCPYPRRRDRPPLT